MTLDEVRRLKQELVAAGAGRLGLTARAWRAGACAGILAAGLTTAGPPYASPLAFGVERARRRGDEPPQDDYRLAVRVLRTVPGVQRAVDRVRAAAGGEVSVRLVGYVLPQAAGRRRTRPLLAGSSLGAPGGPAGTLGAVVEPLGGGRRLLLASGHVLSPPGAVVGDGVLQPAPADAGTLPRDRVGRLARVVRPDVRRRNRVDAGLAELDEGVATDARRLPGLGRLAGRRVPPLLGGEVVFKVGRTSGVTRGRVSAVEVDDLAVLFRRCGAAVFDGVFEVEMDGGGVFSKPGDSGALVVDEERRAVGMVLAGNGVDLSYAVPVGTVLDRLRVRLA